MWLVDLVNLGVHARGVEECGETAPVVFNSAEHNTRETRPRGTALLYHHVSQAGGISGVHSHCFLASFPAAIPIYFWKKLKNRWQMRVPDFPLCSLSFETA